MNLSWKLNEDNKKQNKARKVFFSFSLSWKCENRFCMLCAVSYHNRLWSRQRNFHLIFQCIKKFHRVSLCRVFCCWRRRRRKNFLIEISPSCQRATEEAGNEWKWVEVRIGDKDEVVSILCTQKCEIWNSIKKVLMWEWQSRGKQSLKYFNYFFAVQIVTCNNVAELNAFKEIHIQVFLISGGLERCQPKEESTPSSKWNISKLTKTWKKL